MKLHKLYRLAILAGFPFLFTLPVNAQFVTIARKIKSMHTSESDVATVILDAKTYKVYRALTDTLSANPKFSITSLDNTKRCVEFTTQNHKVSMQVDSLERDLCQITVASLHLENVPEQPTDYAVDAILKVCRMVGIRCTVDNK
jgi:hypothetical protein